MGSYVNKGNHRVASLDNYSLFLLKTERVLTKIAMAPIIIGGAVKVVLGTLQTVICSIAWLIFKIPAKDNKAAQKRFETAQVYILHGLANIVCGLVEAIPFIGLISACYVRPKVCEGNLDHQDDKFVPYPEIGISANY